MKICIDKETLEYFMRVIEMQISSRVTPGKIDEAKLDSIALHAIDLGYNLIYNAKYGAIEKGV